MVNKFIYAFFSLLLFLPIVSSAQVQYKACQVIQITDGEEDSRNPFVCGDGTGILFISRADLLDNGHPDQEDLFFADITDPFNPVFFQLTNTPEDEGRPSISDDCSNIAFSSRSDLTGGNPLHDNQLFYGDISDPNNPIYTQLTNVIDESFSPEISGDGTKIAVGSGADLTGMNPDLSFEYFIFDDNNLVVPFGQLTDSPNTGGIFSRPATNRVGTRVAFSASSNYNPPGNNPNGARQVFLSDVSFDAPNPPPNVLFQLTQLPDNDFFTQGVDISSTGDRIVFASNYAITGMSPDPERDIFIADVVNPANPVFTRITKSALFTASSAIIDRFGNNIAFVTDNAQFTPQRNDVTETVVMADITNPTSPSFMSLVDLPIGADIDDLSAPTDFAFFVFESDDDITSENADGTEELFLIIPNDCPVIIPPSIVPTLSEWGLIAMASILGIVGFLVARRRKVTA